MQITTTAKYDPTPSSPDYQPMFGKNWEEVQREVIGQRGRLRGNGIKHVMQGPRWKGEPNSPEIIIAMYDLNPEVFGANGNLRKLLEGYAEQNGQAVRLMAVRDSSNSFREATQIPVRIDPNLEGAYWDQLPLETHELILAVDLGRERSFFAKHLPDASHDNTGYTNVDFSKWLPNNQNVDWTHMNRNFDGNVTEWLDTLNEIWHRLDHQ
jgi:hypothetical protein